MNASIIVGTDSGICPYELLISDVDVYLIGNNMLEGNIRYLYRLVSDRIWKIGLALLMLKEFSVKVSYLTIEKLDDLSRKRIQRASKKYRKFYDFHFINVFGDVSLYAIKRRIEYIKKTYTGVPVRIGIILIAPRMPFEAQLAKAEKIENLGFDTFIYLEPIKVEEQLEILKEHDFHRVAVNIMSMSIGAWLLRKLVEEMYEVVLLYPLHANIMDDTQRRVRPLFTVEFVTTIEDSRSRQHHYRPSTNARHIEKIPLPIIANTSMIRRF